MPKTPIFIASYNHSFRSLLHHNFQGQSQADKLVPHYFGYSRASRHLKGHGLWNIARAVHRDKPKVQRVPIQGRRKCQRVDSLASPPKIPVLLQNALDESSSDALRTALGNDIYRRKLPELRRCDILSSSFFTGQKISPAINSSCGRLHGRPVFFAPGKSGLPPPGKVGIWIFIELIPHDLINLVLECGGWHRSGLAVELGGIYAGRTQWTDLRPAETISRGRILSNHKVSRGNSQRIHKLFGHDKGNGRFVIGPSAPEADIGWENVDPAFSSFLSRQRRESHRLEWEW
mmetsp:Transcript_15055/g.31224  ORF Transcript_15055/g.31224 Transcript_15055/m.31224 type:complete len:289 (-) Transcript_15055:107-973(-)